MPPERNSHGFHVVVAAEPIENGAGLATFVLDSVTAFARYRPAWLFTVLALSWFGDAAALRRSPNVRVLFCDRVGWRGTLSRWLPRFRGRERVFDLIAARCPSAAVRRQFGNLAEIWAGLRYYDAVWVPHFAISQSRWPALYRHDTVKAPVLLTIHDLHAAVFPQEWQDKPRMLDNFWTVFRPFAQRADAIITHSNFQKEAIIRHFNVPEQRINVAYLPLPQNDEMTTDDRDPREEQRTLLALGITRPYCFCPMSQIAEHKNHMRAIAAWAIVRDRMADKAPCLVFTAAGSPDHQKRFKQEIERQGLSGMVLFTGMVDRGTLAVLYRNCLALLSPTLYEGGGGYPVMEGILAGKPVCCSRIAPIVEQLTRFGLEVNYFDPIDPADIARSVIGALARPAQTPQRDTMLLRKRQDVDQRAFAATYCSTFSRIAMH